MKMHHEEIKYNYNVCPIFYWKELIEQQKMYNFPFGRYLEKHKHKYCLICQNIQYWKKKLN